MMGSIYYRIWKPIRPTSVKYLFVPPMYAGEDIDQMVANCDIILIKNVLHLKAAYALIRASQNYGKPIFYDIDDDYFHLPTENHDSLKITEESRDAAEFALKNAAAVFVATEPLGEIYKGYNDNTYLLKNYNDITEWRHGPVEKRPDGRICIGWAGSHGYEFPEYFKAAKILWDKYGQKIIFRFDGSYPIGVEKFLPKEAYEIYPEMKKMYKYIEELPQWGYDIGVAPLLHSTFNDCKSHNKWMEYASYKIPMVGQNFGPYRRECKHGEDAVLADTTDEWVDALSGLIDNPDERIRIGEAAYQSVVKNWQWKEKILRWDEIIKKYLNAHQA